MTTLRIHFSKPQNTSTLVDMNTYADIAIIVDNPNRDLPACMLLAQYIVASSDLRVALVQMNRAVSTLFALAPRYVLLNYARPNNARLIRELQNCGIEVGILDTEGGIFTIMPQTGELNYFNTVIPDNALRARIKHYFVWGKSIFEAIQRKNLYTSEQLILTGTPRSDFYHHNYIGPTLSEPHDKIILVNTSFALTNPKYSSFEKEISMLQKTFGYDQDYLNLLAEQIYKVEKVMIEQVRSLATAFPNQKIVFRPHPFENEKKYENLFKSLSNVLVGCSGTVDVWLKKSAMLLHYECSTAIEAACLGVPALSPAGYESVRPIHEANSVTHFYESTEELLRLTEAILNSQYAPPSQITEKVQETIENVYYKLDGQAHRRIGDEIIHFLNISPPSQHKTFWYNCKYQFQLILKKILRRNLPPASKNLTSDKVRPVFEQLQSAFKPALELKSYKSYHLIQKRFTRDPH